MSGVEDDAGGAMETVQFSLPVGETFLRASAQLPLKRTTLTQLLPILQNLENVIVDKVGEEARRAGKSVSCRAGCGACCRQMAPVSLFEAEALSAWMRSLPEARRRDLEQRFQSALSTLRDAGVIDRILAGDWALDEEQTTQLAIDYFHAGVACPFLEDESCSIHPMRPLSCREYLVTSPPELCQDPSAHEVSGVQLPLKLSRALYAFGQEMTQDARGWIPLVFLVAWGRRGATPGEYVAGSGREVLRAFLDRAAPVSASAKD
jgi:Fe-S-cluster containining protein